MCGIATFTIDVSISSSTAASVTAIAIRYLYLYLSSSTTEETASVGRGRTRICAVPRGPDEISVSSVRGLNRGGPFATQHFPAAAFVSTCMVADITGTT